MNQLDNKKIKLGQLVLVQNTNRKTLENIKYVALQIQDFDRK